MVPAKAHVLTINGGSSSIKFAMYAVDKDLRRVVAGSIERIGAPGATFKVTGLNPVDNFTRSVAAADHPAAVGALMDWIGERIGHGQLAAVGHRVVHGGPKYSQPQLITPNWLRSCTAWSRSIPNICRKRSF